MGPDDIEHPDTLSEALNIEGAGGRPWVEAIAELVAVVDTLFDGPGVPAYAGASRRAQDVMFEHLPPHGAVRMFVRQFWGSTGESVVGVVCEKAQRPALMAIVPVDLNIGGARNLDVAQATAFALALARQRASALQWGDELMAKTSRLNERFAGNEAFEAAHRRAQSYIRIGTELRRMRENMGLTQAAMAARAGLDQSDVSKIEAGIWGKRGISFETLDRLLPVFGLRVVHGISPLPGAQLSKDDQARARAINELMQQEL